MMQFYTLASSSSGNASLLITGGTRLLIDAGISCMRIRRSLAALGLTMDDLDGILITHAHTDHIAGIATLIKRHAIPSTAVRKPAVSYAISWPGWSGISARFLWGRSFA